MPGYGRNRLAETGARSKNPKIATLAYSLGSRVSDAGASFLIARFFRTSMEQTVLVRPGTFAPRKACRLAGLGTEWRTETGTAAAHGLSEAGGQSSGPYQASRKDRLTRLIARKRWTDGFGFMAPRGGAFLPRVQSESPSLY